MEKMIILLFIFLGSFLIVTIISFLIDCSSWCDLKDDRCPRISYKNFRNFYAIAPEKWDFDSRYHPYYYGKVVEFNSYIDVIKYQYFRSQLEKHTKEIERNKRQAAFLGEIQKDIDEYRDKTEKETAAALKHIIIKEGNK